MWSTAILCTALVFLGWDYLQLHKEVAAVEKHNSHLHKSIVAFKEDTENMRRIHAEFRKMASIFEHRIAKLEKEPSPSKAAHVSEVLTKLAKLETHVHHEDALLRKVGRIDADAHHRDNLLEALLRKVGRLDADAHHRDNLLEELEKEQKLTSKQVMQLKFAEKKEAVLSTKLARLSAEVHSDKTTEEKAEKADNKKIKRVVHLKGALLKEEALLLKKFRRLNVNVHFRAKRFRALLKKLDRKEKATLKQVERLRQQDSQAWMASVVRRDLNKTKVWRWFQDVAREEVPLRRAIEQLTSEISKAKSNARGPRRSSNSEFKSSERALARLKDDMKELTLHRLPRRLKHDMKVAQIAMTFLQAAAHPHVWHHGYIYATMDFADPSGDDDGGPPTNGHQPHFLSLPKGWQLAPATVHSRRLSFNFGWSTDCLTFSDGTSWQTSDGGDNSSCGKHTLRSNKKKQYRPKPDGDHSRRILMRFPVPKELRLD